MSESPPERELPLPVIGFYIGVTSVLLALTHIFNILPLPFIRQLGVLAGFSLILGLVAVALGMAASRNEDLEPEAHEMARNAVIAGGAGVLLFIALFVLGVVIGPFFT